MPKPKRNENRDRKVYPKNSELLLDRKPKLVRDFEAMGFAVSEWYSNLKSVQLRPLVPNDEHANQTAIFSADMINDFCKIDRENPSKTPLASDRIDSISMPIVSLFQQTYDMGVRHFVQIQEWHEANAVEFKDFPPHGIMNTRGAETIPELISLPFSDKFKIYRKNSLSPAFAHRQMANGQFLKMTKLDFATLLDSLKLRLAIIVGNCTDLCVRELAMYMRMWANEYQKDLRIIIPANCVETYDLPLKLAQTLGVKPHPGDMMHALALYEMSRNGIDVVRKIL